MQNKNKFTIRRQTVVVQKPKLESVPQKPLTKSQVQPSNQQFTQSENQLIVSLKEDQKKLQLEIATLKQYRDKYLEQEKKYAPIHDLNEQLEHELKNRDKEINYYLDKIDNQNKEIKQQKDLIIKLKGKKKDYKKKCRECEQQHQSQQHEHDPFQQLLEMRALLLQMRLTAQILPLFQQQSRLREYQTQAVDIDHMTYEQLLQLEEQMGNVSNGIAREDIRRIPKRMIRSSDNIQGICPVCQCNMEVGEKYRKLGCNHYYHAKCIKSWLLTHNNCPVCKQTVVIVI